VKLASHGGKFPFSFLLHHKTKRFRHRGSPPVTAVTPRHRSRFLPPENPHHRTLLLPHFPLLKNHPIAHKSGTRRHLSPLAGESPSPCASALVAISKGCLMPMRFLCSYKDHPSSFHSMPCCLPLRMLWLISYANNLLSPWLS
jgi:hypothetical protein